MMDFDQANRCGLARLDKLQDYASLSRNGVSIRITHLRLSGQKFTPEILSNLSLFIETNPALEKLEIVRCQIGLDQMKVLASAFVQNKSLKTLCLNHNPLGDAGVKILLISLAKNKNSQLRELLLEDTKAGMESATALGILLSNHDFLETLFLYKNPLGDKGVQALSQGLKARVQSKKKSILKQLSLNEVNMSEEGAYHLSQALLFLKTLILLDVGYNKLGDAGVEHFIPVLELNSALTEFKCDGIASESRVRQIEKLVQNNRQYCQKTNLQLMSI
jgi:Ran GTPase-activating protein (RanGAP) involved in mRNA processing and transport